jgi:hypothetical protein
MKGFVATIAIAAICCVPLRADVTITQTMTMEGGAATMAGGNMNSKLTTRIKGMKARADMEMMGMAMTTLVDLALKEAYLLRADQKTATLMPSTAIPAGVPKMDISFKPTGISKVVQNARCDEYALAMTVNMADMTQGQQLPPEAAAMMEGVKMTMTGSMWIAKSGPGTADYVAFQKTAAAGDMAAVLGGAFGQGANNMSKMMSAIAEAPGIPYLSEITMSIEGTGQMVEMMKQMGNMKITTTVTGVSTDPVADDVFKVPADYKVVK